MDRRSWLPAALASLPAAAVEAGFVSYYSFTGVVTLVTQPSPYGVPVVTGQAVSGFFAYDPSSPDLSPSPDYGQYAGASPPGFGVDFGVAVDGLVRPGADLYLRFRDSTASVFASDALPPSSLTIADFDSASGLLRDVSTGDRIEFAITSLTGVPSPGAAVAALVWGWCGGRRRTRRR